MLRPLCLLSSKSAITRIQAIIVIVLVVIAAVSGTYYMSIPVSPQNKPTPSPTSTAKPAATPTLAPTSPPISPTPSPSPNPMLAVIDQIRDVVIAANSSYQVTFDIYTRFPHATLNSLQFVRGKALVWNIIENKEVTDIESLLPSELVAKSPDENITIFAIVQSFGIYDYQLVEMYWPEKEVVGINAISNRNDTSIAVNTVTANWINSLPKRDFIPAHTIIADVQGLVLEAKSSYQTPLNETTLDLKGRALVWNFYLADREASDVEEFLPSELLANTLNGEITLFAIVGENSKNVGTYSNGGSAMQIYRDVLVMKWPEKEVIGRHTVEGERPPIMITVYGGSTAGATGNITKPTAEWILSTLAASTLTPTPTPTSTPIISPSQMLIPTPTATSTPTSTIPKYSLSEAMTAGYVEANITGSSNLLFGVSSGDSIYLNIKRLVDFTIEINVIPTGTLLVASGDAQNMAVLNLKGLSLGYSYSVRDKIILDTPNAVRYLFSGYCVSFSKSNPTISTRFTQSGMADQNVLKIYSVLSKLPANVTGISAIQTAIFVVTDNISQSELQSRYSSGVAEIQNARKILEAAAIDVSTKRLFT